jgi:hypothetical protein
MKNNGWSATAEFLCLHKEMKESFHEGKEECPPRHELRLLKLHSIGKRAIAMSILPEE